MQRLNVCAVLYPAHPMTYTIQMADGSSIVCNGVDIDCCLADGRWAELSLGFVCLAGLAIDLAVATSMAGLPSLLLQSA